MTSKWHDWFKTFSNERILVSDFTVVGLCDSLLMGLGQDQQQHSAVHIGGANRGRLHGYCCWPY